MTHRRVDTPLLARVEGQGALHVRVEDGVVSEVRVDIFEPPRYFERLVVGRPFTDVLDITARICGVCPVAYQMTASHAFEQLFGVEVPDGIRALRRLFYCGEWIQSHMLHVHLLAAPDFLGLPDALAMAAVDRAAFDRGLRLRGVGAEIMRVVGGRSVHPVSPVVGGFSRVPRPDVLQSLEPALRQAASDILEVAAWAARFEPPSLVRAVELLALVGAGEYPMNEGIVATASGRTFSAAAFEAVTEEVDVAHSTARHARLREEGAAMVGPLARVNLNAAHLTPLAREAADLLGLTVPEFDPYRSLAARVVETALAIEEALSVVTDYRPPSRPNTPVVPCAGRAVWVTEAPRGLLYQRFDVDADGRIVAARIVPPTSHNLPSVEHDVGLTVAGGLDCSDDELRRRCEMAVRNYDPCISCASHCVRLHIERSG